ncbi:MAG TPA: thioesterase domain-containing protein [Burkholderiales bacterium]
MSARLEPPHTVGGAIARRARRAPATPALVGADGASVSYAALAGAIAATRLQLGEAGLRREDRIGAILPPDLAGARLLVALASNISVLPIDPELEADAIDALVDATGIKALVRATPEGTLQLEHLAPAREPATLRPTRGVDVALLLRSHDSRALRTLYPLTHRDLRAVAGRLQRSLGRGASPSVGCRVPFHGAGIEVWLFAPLIVGASVALGAAGTLTPEQRLAAEALLRAPSLRGEAREAQPVAPSNLPGGELPGPGPADDLLELEVRDLWRRLLLRDDMGFDEDFFEAGGDSLLATQMLLELETLAGRPYPESALSGLTIRRIAAVLREQMPEERRCITQAKAGDVWQRARSIRRMARMLKDRDRGWINAAAGAAVPLFFCHGDFQARGLYAHQLAAFLPQDQPVYLLHPQREPAPGTTVEELAARYLEEVLPLAQGTPVILGGYCNGGFVAWHLAHLLRARGVPVAVFLVETPSFNGRPAVRKAARLLRAAGAVLPGSLGRMLREEAMRAVWSLYRHGAWQFGARLWRAACARLRRSGSASTVPSWWLFVRGMATRYLPPAIDADVYCFVADEGSALDTDPASWRGFARSVTEVKVPGTHLSAVISHRRALAAAFARAIREAAARSGVSAPREAPRRSPSRAAPAGQPG